VHFIDANDILVVVFNIESSNEISFESLDLSISFEYVIRKRIIRLRKINNRMIIIKYWNLFSINQMTIKVNAFFTYIENSREKEEKKMVD